MRQRKTSPEHREWARANGVGANTKNLTGMRFGHLTAVYIAGRAKRRNITWMCRCDCGAEHVTVAVYLLVGDTQSCRSCGYARVARAKTRHGGCINRRRGPEMAVFQSMIDRCETESNPAYHRYGGRGIRVAPEWRHDFGAFIAHIGKRPTPQHQLDRINNDGNYEPGNVRWATRIQNANNKSNNIHLTWDGRTQTLPDWAREMGLNVATLDNRYRAGWPIERMLTTPPRFNRRWHAERYTAVEAA
jgi:hypothetical protein